MKKSRPSNIDLAFHSYAQSDAELKKSEISTSSFFLPSLVSKLDPNERNEVRLAAIRALIESFTKNCAHSRDDRMSDVAISSLREIILSKKSKTEHNEALRLICAFSLGRRSEFSVRARMLINDILPSIANLSSEYDSYRTFAISFLVANSIEGREDSLEIFKAFLDAFINATTTIVRSNKNQNKSKTKNKPRNTNENSANEDNGNSNANNNNDDSIPDNNNENKQINDANNNENPPKEDNENSNTDNNNDNSISVDDNQNTSHANDEENSANENSNVYNNNENPISVNDKSNNNHTNEVNNNENSNDENSEKELIKPKEDEKIENDSNHSDQKPTENSSINTKTELPTNDPTYTEDQNLSQEITSTSTFSVKPKTKFRGSTQSLRELLQGITLIASSLPSEAAAEDLIEEITTVINVSIGIEIDCGNPKEVQQIDPLIATDALDLFLVVHECLVERQEELHVSQSASNKVSNFMSHFRPFIESIHRRANLEGGNKGKNKAREKSLRSKIADVLRCVDGISKRTIDLAFNEQRVAIEGARKVVVADAVKRVTQKNFLSHLQANIALQSDLGFSLVSNQSAVKLMKRFKPEIKQERVMSKKEREMDRMKKRKMKEDRSKNYDE